MSLVGASRRTAVAVVELALLLAFGAEARAEQGPAAGPRRANGARSVVSKPAPPETKRAAPAKASEPAKAASRPAYQKSRPPKQPSPTLPEGTPRPELDSATRQQIAGGATEDDRENGANDPELR
ncbi:MAG TPA: hypothetical protein VGJ84_18385, partial [Polyangiaceae bacterium]